MIEWPILDRLTGLRHQLPLTTELKEAARGEGGWLKLLDLGSRCTLRRLGFDDLPRAWGLAYGPLDLLVDH